jgi:hypothetical protein
VCPPAGTPLQNNSPCNVEPNLDCQSPIFDACDNTTVIGYFGCSCQGGLWSCQPYSRPGCIDAGPPSCPDPTQVLAGTPCMSLGQQCPGDPKDCGGQTFYEPMECQGHVWVSLATTICDIDEGFIDAGTFDE